MLPNGMPMRLTRLLLMMALAAAVVLALRSSGAKPGAVQCVHVSGLLGDRAQCLVLRVEAFQGRGMGARYVTAQRD